jgi:hypothetical protein
VPAEEWVEEANLLNMPDDPDEAMVWLEGIAQGRAAPAAGPVEASPPETLAPADTAAQIEATALVEPATPAAAGTEVSPSAELSAAEPASTTGLTPGVRVNLRKRRFVIREGQPAAPETAESAWVDDLKPLA